MNNSMTFSNASNSFQAMLEAFFCVQLNEHVKAWRWEQYTKGYDSNKVDAALRKAASELRSARNV